MDYDPLQQDSGAEIKETVMKNIEIGGQETKPSTEKVTRSSYESSTQNALTVLDEGSQNETVVHLDDEKSLGATMREKPKPGRISVGQNSSPPIAGILRKPLRQSMPNAPVAKFDDVNVEKEIRRASHPSVYIPGPPMGPSMDLTKLMSENTENEISNIKSANKPPAGATMLSNEQAMSQSDFASENAVPKKGSLISAAHSEKPSVDLKNASKKSISLSKHRSFQESKKTPLEDETEAERQTQTKFEEGVVIITDLKQDAGMPAQSSQASITKKSAHDSRSSKNSVTMVTEVNAENFSKLQPADLIELEKPVQKDDFKRSDRLSKTSTSSKKSILDNKEPTQTSEHNAEDSDVPLKPSRMKRVSRDSRSSRKSVPEIRKSSVIQGDLEQSTQDADKLSTNNSKKSERSMKKASRKSLPSREIPNDNELNDDRPHITNNQVGESSTIDDIPPNPPVSMETVKAVRNYVMTDVISGSVAALELGKSVEIPYKDRASVSSRMSTEEEVYDYSPLKSASARSIPEKIVDFITDSIVPSSKKSQSGHKSIDQPLSWEHYRQTNDMPLSDDEEEEQHLPNNIEIESQRPGVEVTESPPAAVVDNQMVDGDGKAGEVEEGALARGPSNHSKTFQPSQQNVPKTGSGMQRSTTASQKESVESPVQAGPTLAVGSKVLQQGEQAPVSSKESESQSGYAASVPRDSMIHDTLIAQHFPDDNKEDENNLGALLNAEQQEPHPIPAAGSNEYAAIASREADNDNIKSIESKRSKLNQISKQSSTIIKQPSVTQTTLQHKPEDTDGVIDTVAINGADMIKEEDQLIHFKDTVSIQSKQPSVTSTNRLLPDDQPMQLSGLDAAALLPDKLSQSELIVVTTEPVTTTLEVSEENRQEMPGADLQEEVIKMDSVHSQQADRQSQRLSTESKQIKSSHSLQRQEETRGTSHDQLLQPQDEIRGTSREQLLQRQDEMQVKTSRDQLSGSMKDHESPAVNMDIAREEQLDTENTLLQFDDAQSKPSQNAAESDRRQSTESKKSLRPLSTHSVKPLSVSQVDKLTVETRAAVITMGDADAEEGEEQEQAVDLLPEDAMKIQSIHSQAKRMSADSKKLPYHESIQQAETKSSLRDVGLAESKDKAITEDLQGISQSRKSLPSNHNVQTLELERQPSKSSAQQQQLLSDTDDLAVDHQIAELVKASRESLQKQLADGKLLPAASSQEELAPIPASKHALLTYSRTSAPKSSELMKQPSAASGVARFAGLSVDAVPAAAGTITDGTADAEGAAVVVPVKLVSAVSEELQGLAVGDSDDKVADIATGVGAVTEQQVPESQGQPGTEEAEFGGRQPVPPSYPKPDGTSLARVSLTSRVSRVPSQTQRPGSKMKDVAPLQTHVELPSADVEVVPPKVSTSGLMSPRHKPMPSKLSHEDTERIPDAGSATSLALTDGDEDEGEQREDIEHEQPEGVYDPEKFQSLDVTQEIQDLFKYITSFELRDIELTTKLKPFMPEYMASVTDVDAFVKMPRPDGKPDYLGLKDIDEPSTRQSDPTVIDLHLHHVIKQPIKNKEILVRSLENADKNFKSLDKWIENIRELHKTKPATTVHYSSHMPTVESLMQEWPTEVEDLLKEIGLPTADIECNLDAYTDTLLAILDIPIFKSRIQSLHILFELFSEFKNSQHFRNIAATALRNALPPPAAQPSFDGGQGQADQLTL